jgi:hypothetical protein
MRFWQIFADIFVFTDMFAKTFVVSHIFAKVGYIVQGKSKYAQQLKKLAILA